MYSPISAQWTYAQSAEDKTLQQGCNMSSIHSRVAYCLAHTSTVSAFVHDISLEADLILAGKVRNS